MHVLRAVGALAEAPTQGGVMVRWGGGANNSEVSFMPYLRLQEPKSGVCVGLKKVNNS